MRALHSSDGLKVKNVEATLWGVCDVVEPYGAIPRLTLKE